MATKKSDKKTVVEELPPNTFRFQHWGAINRIDLTIPDDEPGGVRVLMGDEGSGKSTIVESLSALADTKPKFPQTPLDGFARGTFEAPGGVVIEIYPTRTGPVKLSTLGVRILNGGHLATLIDPNLKGEKERSRARNQALCGLVKLDLTETALEAMTKGDANLRKVVPPGATLLDAADFVREKANQEALEAKEAAEAAGIEATSSYAAASEIDASLTDTNQEFALEPSTVAEAMAVLQTATRDAENKRISFQARQDLELQKDELREVHGDSPAAQLEQTIKALADIDRRLPSRQVQLGGLEQLHRSLTNELSRIAFDLPSVDREIAELLEKLAGLRERQSALQNRQMQIQEQLGQGELAQIEQHRREVSELSTLRTRTEEDRTRLERELRNWERRQAILDKPLDEYATAEQVEAADKAIVYAQRCLERAQEYKKVLDFMESHRQAKARAKQWQERELWFRDIGWNVIPQIIAGRLQELGIPGLDMKGGVLYAHHEKRGMIPFDALSPGQQVRWALKIALRGRKDAEPAILPFPQEAWDAMTPRAHALFRYEAKQAKVWIYTATARYNGPLREETAIPEEEEAFLLQIEEHGEDGIDVEKFLLEGTIADPAA